MKTAIVSINQASASIAKIIKQELDAKTVVRTKVGSVWNEYDAFIFIGALGICVRTIASYIKDKHRPGRGLHRLQRDERNLRALGSCRRCQ